MELEITKGAFPSDDLAGLESGEAQLVSDVAERYDTVSLLIRSEKKLIGYAVMGFDNSDMVTVYAARSVNSVLARVAMKAIFGAAQVIGAPLRVHTDKLRAMARMMGAGDAVACFDADGLPMGVFNGV